MEQEEKTLIQPKYLVWTDEDDDRLQKLEILQRNQKKWIDEWLDLRKIEEYNNKKYLYADMEMKNDFYNIIQSFNAIEQYKKIRYGFNL